MSFDAVRVRDARIGDAADVAQLLEALGYPCTRDEAAERIAVVLSDARQRLLLAELDGRACGLASLDIRFAFAHGGEQARITALVVSPDCERQGIGRRLLREVEAIARQAGAVRVEVTSSATRETAHAFYRECGYADSSMHFMKRLGD